VIEDGAKPDVIRDRVTHTKAGRDAFSGYDRGPHWIEACGEVSKLQLTRRLATSFATAGQLLELANEKSWRRRESNSTTPALHDALITESRGLRIVDSAPSAVERSGTQRDAAEPLQVVADPVAAELEAALALRRSGADAKVLRRALRRIEELLDE
jgi:hypothetical protein